MNAECYRNEKWGESFLIVVGESEYILMLGVVDSKYSNSQKNEALLTDL